jgi:hypothetical protein
LCKHAGTLLQDADIGCYRKFFPDELPQNVVRQMKFGKISEIRATTNKWICCRIIKEFLEIDALGPDKNQPKPQRTK